MSTWREEVWKYWETRKATPSSMMKLSECAEFEIMEREEILSLLPSWKNRRILDLAAGIGRFTQEFAKEAMHVTAVEWIPAFVVESQKRNTQFSHVAHICDDATNIEFPDGSFDLVFVNWLLLYLEDDAVEKILGRIDRWLAPGGFFFLRESCAASRIEPVDANPSCYRTSQEYDAHLQNFSLLQKGTIQCWAKQFPTSLNQYWLVRKR